MQWYENPDRWVVWDKGSYRGKELADLVGMEKEEIGGDFPERQMYRNVYKSVYCT